MARQASYARLWEVVEKALPAGVPLEAINDVECDPYDGECGGYSYWVYLNDGWISPTMGCHTIHEDTLENIREMVAEVEPWHDDPDLIAHKGYTTYKEG